MEKKLGEVVTKEGVVKTESKADELAIKAASILVMMDKDDVNRYKELKEPTPVLPPTVNVTVTNNNVINTDTRRVELARLALKFGARELVIDGESVPCADIVGEPE